MILIWYGKSAGIENAKTKASWQNLLLMSRQTRIRIQLPLLSADLADSKGGQPEQRDYPPRDEER